ncbi:hypothetical protein [Allosphingosinicella deserti]|uniref:hypothetical protein n=1 Tax=Allosphingosinicella deserti TaxID=2116704 RepID=UPI0011B1EC88|nr:hypothetical protein [Sphingomonas deserti]
MSKFELQMPVEHAVLFLSDPSVDETVPEDTSASAVTATGDCICFWVQSDVDGPSDVTVSDQPCDRGGIECFTGELLTPQRIVTLSTSRGFAYLNVPVRDESTEVRIWMSDAAQPEWAWVKLPIGI